MGLKHLQNSCRIVAFFCFTLLFIILSVVNADTKVYKYIDENGKVVYTSNPPNHLNNIEEIELQEANTTSPLQIKAKQDEVIQKHDRVSNRIKQRISDREKRAAEIRAARQEVAKKKEALEKGKIPLPGERLGTNHVFIGPAARLTQEYHDRVELLDKELKIAEEKLKELQKNKNGR